jgi:hypothetical protein
VLAGPPGVERTLAGDPAVAGRVEIKVRLAALDAEAARAYVAHRLAAVGGKATLFDAAALGALVRASGGVPRLLNTLADNALFEAHVARRSSVSHDDVVRAANDLGLDPEGPGKAPAREAAPAAAKPAAPPGASPHRTDTTQSLRAKPAARPAQKREPDELGEIALDAEAALDAAETLADVFDAPAAMGDVDTAIEDPVFEHTDPEVAPLFENTGGDGPPKEEEIEELFDQLLDEPR